ncbi:MCE family protein [Actinomadura madurae]|uniref:MCE family protein n=1 Tax=Actinomadura madurae TaxID=1993 RepID=UPI002025C635|nr:MCE family protein [Actinomadura madurae]MCP9953730.1 MCE family protein [Actinomadura madurae]MCP9970484.1 MCE family protein [Actinomadura madurae]MCP9982964.1 MCE family protein [Actinomadura madurae]MCQ0005486.1 MCE family protein [Actinomadura madurae]MCQ0019199.1 MCE family protein [Actinomadura madurae]
MAKRTTRHVVGQRLTGVAFLLVPALLIWLSIAIYNKQFTDVTTVTLRTGTAGHEMHPLADVKVRGVVVGEVRSITADGAGAKLELALKPAMTDRVPSDVQARLLPTTVFGARFVSLVPPDGSTAPPIAEGAVISEDRSRNAVELSEVLNHTMDLLNTVQPAKLSATLNAMSRALEGRGDQIGRNFEQLDAFLTRLNPEVPALARNLDELAEFSRHASDAAPDLLQALTDFTVTSRTIVEQRLALASLYDTVSASSADLDDFLRANSGNIIELASASRGSLDLLRRYAPAAPCTFRTFAEFVPKMDKVLGKGTDRHGVHGVVVSIPHKGRYVPGRDAPRYDGGDGPHCPSVPYLASGNGVRVLPAGGAPGGGGAAGSGLGPANSASENDLVNELAGPSLDEVPEELPDWSSVLVGPIYRGTEVTVR